MKQRTSQYLIIGDGKMASHFCHYLTLLCVPFLQWSRKNPHDLLESLLQSNTIVFVLISDSAINPFVNDHPCLQNHTLIHFSGALRLDGIHGTHPLMTFGKELYDLETYTKIPFILEDEEPDLSKLLPDLPNSFFKIPKNSKPYYHALCVLSGNFSCILWQKFFSELETRFNLPVTIGVPYLSQITKNLIQNPHAALTGPLSRDDKQTITENLKALDGDEFQSVYQTFVDLFQNRKT